MKKEPKSDLKKLVEKAAKRGDKKRQDATREANERAAAIARDNAIRDRQEAERWMEEDLAKEVEKATRLGQDTVQLPNWYCAELCQRAGLRTEAHSYPAWNDPDGAYSHDAGTAYYLVVPRR